MSAKNAIAAFTAVLKGVAATGPKVYDQIRYSRDPEGFTALFVDAQTDPANPFVHTWMITREATRGADKVMQAAGATHQVVATGFRAFQDGVSEPQWQDELDQIFAALIPYLGRHMAAEGNEQYFDWSGAPQIEGVKMAFFGTVLCHTARIIMPFEEFPL